MRLFRLYSGDDQQSHLEELKMAFAPGRLAEQTPLQPATGVIFTRMAAGAFVDWHNAPRRQYVITLAGGVEIGLGDGSLHRFGPGEGILAEDLTGKGHTTRAVGDGPGDDDHPTERLNSARTPGVFGRRRNSSSRACWYISGEISGEIRA